MSYGYETETFADSSFVVSGMFPLGIYLQGQFTVSQILPGSSQGR